MIKLVPCSLLPFRAKTKSHDLQSCFTFRSQTMCLSALQYSNLKVMSNCNVILVLCFGVVLSARLTMALGGFEMELLMTKLDFLQDKLQEVEHTMKTAMENSLKGTEYRLQEKLTKHESNNNEKIATIEAKMHTIEDSLKKVYEKNTRTTLEELKNYMMPKMNRIHETSKTVEENKEILVMLKNSIHDLTTNAEVRSSLKETEHRLQAKMNAMKDYLKKSVEASEKNTRTKLEELKNHMIPKMDHIHETSQTELKKLGENKEILNMLKKSIHNLTTNAETRSKTLEDHLITPVRSCRQVTRASGTYLFRLRKTAKSFEVFCEQNKFDGGWTVIQHRFDGSVDFYRNWTEYRNGFGNVEGEFWLGLEYVHQITKNRPHELLVEVKDFYGNYGYAKYDEFEIGNESELYVLKKLGAYSGTVRNSMEYHKNQMFSTFDRDNDLASHDCAEEYHGAWWYRSCHESNLNGRYENTTNDASAMVWKHCPEDWIDLSYSRMMIRDIID